MCLSRPLKVNQIKQRARIIAVGVTDAIEEEQLRSMATNPDTDYFTVDAFDQLEDQLGDIVGSVSARATSSLIDIASSLISCRYWNYLAGVCKTWFCFVFEQRCKHVMYRRFLIMLL